MPTRPLLALLAVVATCTTVVAPADARRPATPEEAAAVGASLGTAPNCAAVFVSTAAPGWASWAGKPECFGERSLVVLQHDPGVGRWWTVAEGVGRTQPCREWPAVPERAALDLAICEVTAPAFADGGVSLRARPARISLGVHASFTQLRWGRWTRAEARGRGRFAYADPDDQFRVPIRIRLHRPRQCPSGDIVFTRVAWSARRKRDRAKVRALRRSTRLTDCEQIDS